MTTWTKECCSEQPNELEVIGRDTYIQRKNIKKVTHLAENDIDEYSNWECECRMMSFSEYNMLTEIETISIEKVIDAYTEQLIEDGVL